MSRKRAHISTETRLASTLLALRDSEGRPFIPYEHSKLMTAAQVISLFAWDHNILHSQDGSDEHWNLTPLNIIDHRKKTATIDVKQAAKSKRLMKARAALDHFLATGEKPPIPTRAKRKIASRGFPEGHRPLRSRGFPERRAP